MHIKVTELFSNKTIFRFPNLGIQHVTKKNVASILEERYIAAEMQLSSINDGFPQEVQRNIKGIFQLELV